MAVDQGVADAAGEFETEKRSVPALALRESRVTRKPSLGSNTQMSAGAPTEKVPASMPRIFPVASDAEPAPWQAAASSRRPTSASAATTSARPGDAGFGFVEGHLLGIVIDRRMVGTNGVDRSVGQTRRTLRDRFARAVEDRAWHAD